MHIIYKISGGVFLWVFLVGGFFFFDQTISEVLPKYLFQGLIYAALTGQSYYSKNLLRWCTSDQE